MTRPVEFDDQPGLSTVEIDDTQPNWLLPPKTDAKLPSAQDLPKVALGRRGIGAQDTGAREQQFNVVGWLLSRSPSPRRVKNTPPLSLKGRGEVPRRDNAYSAAVLTSYPSIALTSRNSAKAASPHSRPLPDCL